MYVIYEIYSGGCIDERKDTSYDPYTLKRLLLLLGMVSFCMGIRLLIIVRNYKRKR